MLKKFLLSFCLVLGIGLTDLGFNYSVCMAAPKRKTSKTTKTTSQSSRYTKLTGTVGKYKVTVFLDSDMNGYYYYGNGSKGKLTLKGEWQGAAAQAMNYLLYEYNSSGECTAVWDIWYGRYGVDGEMTTNGKTYPVSLK